jgi:tight adherence protein B
VSWFACGAAVAGSLAFLLARPPSRWVVRVRLGRDASPRGRPWWLRRTGSLGVLAVAVVMFAAATSRLPWVIVAATLAGAGLFAIRQLRASRARAAAEGTRGDTIAALDLLAAELRAGILPGVALGALADDVPALRPAAAAARHGGDVVSALRAAGTEPGAGALVDLAGAWHVAERAGAPLAVVLDRVASAARDDAEVDREVAAEAAPARATGRLMAVLPVFGLGLGAGLGADPVRVLTGTIPGAACLAAGVALAATGVVWVDRIVVAAGAPSGGPDRARA